MPKVEIRQPGAEGNSADIIVNGAKLRGVTGFTIEGSPRTRTKVTLELAVFETDYFGEAGVAVSDRVRETLIRFGWTPPPVDALADAPLPRAIRRLGDEMASYL